MARTSAGILLFRRRSGSVEFLLVHPGGPFWRHRDEGAWTIPKGEPNPSEPLEDAARRELFEETGLRVDGTLIPLTPVKQKGGKVVHAWALEGDCDPATIRSNTFSVTSRDGRVTEFPEVDKAAWFDPAAARTKINPAQAALLVELEQILRRAT